MGTPWLRPCSCHSRLALSHWCHVPAFTETGIPPWRNSNHWLNRKIPNSGAVSDEIGIKATFSFQCCSTTVPCICLQTACLYIHIVFISLWTIPFRVFKLVMWWKIYNNKKHRNIPFGNRKCSSINPATEMEQCTLLSKNAKSLNKTGSFLFETQVCTDAQIVCVQFGVAIWFHRSNLIRIGYTVRLYSRSVNV